MVREIREAEREPREARRAVEDRYGAERVARIEGSGVKKLAASERANYGLSNRSLHAVSDIPAGERIGEGSVAVLRTEKRLRPGIGPEFLSRVVGARATRRIPAGEGIRWEDLL
jgi:sialic acid synthase SpsE